ncbi:MAG: DUF4336 domain-containing protein [Deltaproteobacteria bacterium]|nr:DUF4336 domain-containing protein [Deltaproteobacteria bacterium]
MASERSLLERIVALSSPTWLPGEPAPHELAPGLWSVDRMLGIGMGPRLGTRALLVDLPGGGVLAWAPVPLGAELRAFVEARGGARFLVAPNSFHYLGLAEWQRAFPSAEVWLAPGLRARVRDAVPAGRELVDEDATPFASTFAHRVLAGGRGTAEVAFFHAASRTLALVDSSFNVRHVERWIDRVVWGGYGALGRFGPTKTAHWFLLYNRAAVQAWIERVCAWDFARIVVAHGEPLEAGPRDLRAAFAKYFA